MHPGASISDGFVVFVILSLVTGALIALGRPMWQSPPEPLNGFDATGHFLLLPKGLDQPERLNHEGRLWWSDSLLPDGSRIYRPNDPTRIPH